MNPSKQQQHQTSSSSKKQSSSSQQGVKTNSLPSTPNSRQPNQSQGRRPQQQQVGAQSNKKRNSPSYSNQMEFLSFQPALQGCFQSPQQQYDNKRRSSPRGRNYGNVVSQSAKYSSQVNGYNNSLSPIKLASPAIAPIIRQGNNQQQSNSARRQRGSPLALFKHTPFAGAKYLELPSTKDLPLPPAWMIDGTPAPVSSTETSLSSSPTSMIEPPSPTTEAAIKVAKENGFDGRVRIHPLQLIAAVSSC